MDKDIQDIFKEKNKEILITNLKYDLDKNIGSLFETINNIFNLEFDTAVKKILTILEDGNYKSLDKDVFSIVNKIKLNNYESIDKLIQDKKNILIDKIDHLEFEENKMNDYFETVFDTTKNIKSEISKNFDKDIEYVNALLNEYMINDKELNNDLTSIRMNDYLKNRLYEKLVTKLHMEIMLRDNNLINKAKEVYLRYQDICSKTE